MAKVTPQTYNGRRGRGVLYQVYVSPFGVILPIVEAVEVCSELGKMR